MSHQNTPPNPAGKRHHFSNYWRNQWKENGERMKANLDSINARRLERMHERVRQIEAILPLLPDQLMTPTRLRDLLAENWNDTYGEKMTKQQGWTLFRFAYRNGVIAKLDGLYGTQKQVDQALMMANRAPEVENQEPK